MCATPNHPQNPLFFFFFFFFVFFFFFAFFETNKKRFDRISSLKNDCQTIFVFNTKRSTSVCLGGPIDDCYFHTVKCQTEGP